MDQHFGFSELAKQASLQPKEALLEKHNPNHVLYIGVPKETTLQEGRIPLTPSSIQLLVNNGNEVWIETGAGKMRILPIKILVKLEQKFASVKKKFLKLILF